MTRPESKTYTYAELQTEVQKAGNALKNLGVAKGDRVCIYMQMIPELAIAMLACARIGAVHSIVFGAFTSDSLITRNQRLAVQGDRHPRHWRAWC